MSSPTPLQPFGQGGVRRRPVCSATGAASVMCRLPAGRRAHPDDADPQRVRGPGDRRAAAADDAADRRNDRRAEGVAWAGGGSALCWRRSSAVTSASRPTVRDDADAARRHVHDVADHARRPSHDHHDDRPTTTTTDRQTTTTGRRQPRPSRQPPRQRRPRQQRLRRPPTTTTTTTATTTTTEPLSEIPDTLKHRKDKTDDDTPQALLPLRAG